MPGCHRSTSIVIDKQSAAQEGHISKNMWKGSSGKGTLKLSILRVCEDSEIFSSEEATFHNPKNSPQTLGAFSMHTRQRVSDEQCRGPVTEVSPPTNTGVFVSRQRVLATGGFFFCAGSYLVSGQLA